LTLADLRRWSADELQAGCGLDVVAVELIRHELMQHNETLRNGVPGWPIN
jgi:hypothetical protein